MPRESKYCIDRCPLPSITPITHIESGKSGCSFSARWIRKDSPASHSNRARPRTTMSPNAGWVASIDQSPISAANGASVSLGPFILPLPPSKFQGLCARGGRQLGPSLPQYHLARSALLRERARSLIQGGKISAVQQQWLPRRVTKPHTACSLTGGARRRP